MYYDVRIDGEFERISFTDPVIPATVVLDQVLERPWPYELYYRSDFGDESAEAIEELDMDEYDSDTELITVHDEQTTETH